MNSEKIPLYMINGALGAGKTSVLYYLLGLEEFAGSRVIENEFASTGVDNHLLAGRARDITLISDGCACCTNADELLDALRSFANLGGQPVLLEASGVAHTLGVIERLVMNNIFDFYDLRQAIFVMDGTRELVEAERIEAEAADLVLVSRLDLLDSSEAAEVLSKLPSLGISNIGRSDFGEFDVGLMSEESHLIDYFREFDGEIVMSDLPTYAVIDTASLVLTSDKLEQLWDVLRPKFGLRRLKGAVVIDGKFWLVDAVYDSFAIEPLVLSQLEKIVLIGERASGVSREIFIEELAKLG